MRTLAHRQSILWPRFRALAFGTMRECGEFAATARLLLPGGVTGVLWAVCLQFLEEHGVQTRVCFAGNVTRHPAFRHYFQPFATADEVGLPALQPP